MLALALVVALQTPLTKAPSSAPAAPVAVVDAKSVAGKWIAIAVSLDEGAAAPRLPPVEGAAYARFRSLSLKNLMPCYDVVIGGAFADKRSALALVKKMRDAGIDAYAKNAGAYVGVPPALVAHCARRDSADGTCGALSFVEAHGNATSPRLFARVDDTAATLGEVGAQKPVDGDAAAWAAPYPATAKAGPWQKGYAVDVYDVTDAARLDTCSVARLVSLTRGVPHFGYFQAGEPPTSPGCGGPELFAELACPKRGALTPEQMAHVRLALPAGHRAPTLYKDEPFTGDGAALAAFVARMPAAQEVKAKAERAAAGEPVAQAIDARAFTAGSRRVIGVSLTWSTGDANPCSDDVIEGVLAVVDDKSDAAGARFAVQVPAWPSALSRIEAVYDLEGDGKVEVVEKELSTVVVRRRAGDEAQQICQDVVPFCDCGC